MLLVVVQAQAGQVQATRRVRTEVTYRTWYYHNYAYIVYYVVGREREAELISYGKVAETASSRQYVRVTL